MSLSHSPGYRSLAMALVIAGLASSGAYGQLEEVIVTAQKRAESVQDVPIAITAFDAAAMEARQILGAARIR